MLILAEAEIAYIEENWNENKKASNTMCVIY